LCVITYNALYQSGEESHIELLRIILMVLSYYFFDISEIHTSKINKNHATITDESSFSKENVISKEVGYKYEWYYEKTDDRIA